MLQVLYRPLHYLLIHRIHIRIHMRLSPQMILFFMFHETLNSFFGLLGYVRMLPSHLLMPDSRDRLLLKPNLVSRYLSALLQATLTLLGVEEILLGDIHRVGPLVVNPFAYIKVLCSSSLSTCHSRIPFSPLLRHYPLVLHLNELTLYFISVFLEGVAVASTVSAHTTIGRIVVGRRRVPTPTLGEFRDHMLRKMHFYLIFIPD